MKYRACPPFFAYRRCGDEAVYLKAFNVIRNEFLHND